MSWAGRQGSLTPGLKKLVLGLVASLMIGGCGADSDEYAPDDVIDYRDDLGAHPGCTRSGLDYDAADLPGFACAAKDATPGVDEDVTRPVVLLFHGDSDGPACWEAFPPRIGKPMLAEQLAERRTRAFALDLRVDRNDDSAEVNRAASVDHGWATPLAEHFLRSAYDAFPRRRFVLVGFGLGATTVRDALRRLHLAGANPFARVDHVILASGANHGVRTPESAGGMGAKALEQLGRREDYRPTRFLRALNGRDGEWETPCADGEHAFGTADACGGNRVRYTTIVMHDVFHDYPADDFVSQLSAALAGATNHVTSLNASDESGYFLNGAFRNAYGSIRSAEALGVIVRAVAP